MFWHKTKKATERGRAIVLMYHRIASPTYDPWQLSVSAEAFESHLQVLKNYRVLSLADLLKALKRGCMEERSICITFDDGYTDNFTTALPLLKKYKLPAAFFIPSLFIGQQQPFWWDRLQALVLEPEVLPQLFQNPMPGMAQFDLGADTVLSPEKKAAQQTWIWTEPPPNRRCQLYMEIWMRMKALPQSGIDAWLLRIQEWSGTQPFFSHDILPAGEKRLYSLVDEPLVQTGLHTYSHLALGLYDQRTQRAEIERNRNDLKVYNALPAIAFPYGHFNNITLNTVHELGLQAGFATTPGIVTAQSHPYCLNRVQVTQCSEVGLETMIENWFA